MADDQRRRIRTSYILGLSNKPFKDPPKPPPLNSYQGVIRTPGAAIEWVASDGRRGRLMGKGKSRLLGALDAAATGQANASADTKANANSNSNWNANANANSNQGTPNNPPQPASGGNDAGKQSSSQAAGSDEVEYKKGVPNKDFTEEEDRIIMRMKTDDKSWPDILEHMNGKAKKLVTQRFNEIRPDDFFEKKKANKGNGQGGKQGNQKGQNQNNKGQEKEKEKTAEASGEGGWDNLFPGLEGDNKSNASGQNSKKGDKTGSGEATTVDWGGNDNNAGGNTGWADGANDNNAAGADTWGTNWNTQDGGQKDNNKKDDEKKDSNRQKQQKKDKVNEKSNSQKNKSDAAAESWDDPFDSGGGGATAVWDTGNVGFGSGGGGATAGWDSSGWDNQDGNDKKSESKKSKSCSSRSSKAPSKNSWKADGEAGPGNGGQDWTDNPGAGWNDNKADTGDVQDFTAGWGDAAPAEKDKSSRDDDPKKKNTGADAAIWGSNTWGATPASPRKPSSRASSKDHEKHRSSRRRSDSRESKHRSHRHHSSSHPVEYKVAPDSTFSQDELKLIARILQQDCAMVWERVSWRFKDKTGRNLDPDVFEKKITGTLQRERRH